MPKILVVDDSAFMRRIITKTLNLYNITDIEQASNGFEAVEKYKKQKYDFVTMDVTMNHMNGLEALKEIKNIDPDAKVIMVSAMGQQPMIVEAIRYGAIDFVIKPFSKEKVEETIKRLKEK